MQEFARLVGQGSIGRVYFGCWQETQVAIKVIGNNPIPESAFAPAKDISPDSPVPQIADRALLRTLEREVTTTLLSIMHCW